ncbi:hypothetical protein L1987_23331 [Smallanthus sonchifolius]|uniref:Uncharacterized protein n=1 Tax=Smallanthus sonchifolius TaxID=185202 RepID=A0ACB9IHC4_9ASTR|nr:hypothetical protein L1987_23331 [Smallanthus sonchifolius]
MCPLVRMQAPNGKDDAIDVLTEGQKTSIVDVRCEQTAGPSPVLDPVQGANGILLEGKGVVYVITKVLRCSFGSLDSWRAIFEDAEYIERRYFKEQE